MEEINDSIFIDTWGWLSFFDKKEHFHKEVKTCLEKFTERSNHLITSDYILDETNTILFRRLNSASALKIQNEINKMIDKGYLELFWIDEIIFEKAMDHRRKYSDKPDISFTDFTSFVIMKSLNINNVLTYDRHFEIVGLGFQKLPKV